MANEKSGSGMRPSSRRRPTPTIELTATEIGKSPSGSDPVAETEPSAGKERSRAGGPPPRRPSSAKIAFGWWPAAWPWPLIGAAVTAIVVALALGAWLGGAFTVRESASPNALADRLGRIEAALATPRTDAALASRIAVIENQMKAAADEAAAVRGRLDDIAAAARAGQALGNHIAALEQTAKNVETETARAGQALGNRVAALEQIAKTVETDLAQRKAAGADDGASRLAVAAGALRAAIERGDAFSAELAAAKSLAPNRAELTALGPFAAGGVPSASALARDLSALIPALLGAAGQSSQSGGLLERLQANAERLVRIRPVGEAPGDEPATVIARIEAKAARADLDGALADLAKLSPAMRAPAEPWIAQARAREAALAASRQFARDALATLGKPAL